jgi:flagellar motor protein MotB
LAGPELVVEGMGKNRFEDMDPDIQAMRASMRPNAAPVRWGRVLAGVLVVACATFAFAYHLPLQRAHQTLTSQFSELQSQVDTANRSLEEARGQVKTLTEKRDVLENELKEQAAAEKSRSDGVQGVKDAVAAKLKKAIGKDQASVGTESGKVIASLSLGSVLARGKLDVSGEGKTSLCDVAQASGKRNIRVLAVADEKNIPSTLATKYKTTWDYSTAVAALVAQTLADKCSVGAERLSATGFGSEPPVSPKFEGKRVSAPRVELSLE